MSERLDALREASEICRERIRRYRFEDDVAFGARVCLDGIEALIRQIPQEEEALSHLECLNHSIT